MLLRAGSVGFCRKTSIISSVLRIVFLQSRKVIWQLSEVTIEFRTGLMTPLARKVALHSVDAWFCVVGGVSCITSFTDDIANAIELKLLSVC